MHADHTQVALYMKEVAKASNRILIETTGATFENRPLQLLTISSQKTLLILMKSLKDTKQLQIQRLIIVIFLICQLLYI
jgi:hypothetical protein